MNSKIVFISIIDNYVVLDQYISIVSKAIKINLCFVLFYVILKIDN